MNLVPCFIFYSQFVDGSGCPSTPLGLSEIILFFNLLPRRLRKRQALLPQKHFYVFDINIQYFIYKMHSVVLSYVNKPIYGISVSTNIAK